jgi:AcrR family transcriptional regulator
MARNALTVVEVDSMRSRLCEGALEIFREGGLEAVTFRALADAVGVSHTLPYRYFENKDAMLASVRVMCFAQFERFVRQREAAQRSSLNRVLAVLEGYVDFVLQHPVEYSLIFATAQPPAQRYPDLLAARQSVFEHCVELVQRCLDERVITGDARDLTHMVWGALHGLLTLHVANQLVHGRTLEELVWPTISRLLGLSASEAARRAATAKRLKRTGPLSVSRLSR